MKKYIYSLICGLFLLPASGLFGQMLPNIGFGAGYQIPLSQESPSSAFSTQVQFYYPIFKNRNFSVGPAIGGDYIFSKKVYTPSIPGFTVHERFTSTLFESSNISSGNPGYAWRVGPQFNFKVGKWLLSGIFQTGQSYWSKGDYALEQEIQGAASPVRREIYAREETESSSWLLSPRLRFAYPLSDKIHIWTEGSLVSSIGQITERRIDFPAGTVINPDNIGNFTEAGLLANETRLNRNLSSVQLGLSFQLGKPTRSPAAQVRNPMYKGGTAGVNPIYQGKSMKTNKDERRILKPLQPKNNERFTAERTVRELRWQLLGNKIPSPRYSIELQRIGDLGRPEQSYHGQSETLVIDIAQMAKGNLPEGMYRWQVKEINTGLVSTPQFFTIGNCDIHFRIENDSIVCLGYEGEYRKYKICFESAYSSNSGDLTYSQGTSGLQIFDQSYNALSYTLVGTNTSLQTQIGSTLSTVHYCVEVLVPASVTSLGIGLQGDDVDPSPVVCRPGVSQVLDSLPECICKECDELTMDIQNMQIGSYNGQTNQFQFAGDLVANHPLYAVEVQVLSFSYAAQPSPCSPGVSVLEEAGMILRPGTTINSSTALQFMNSSANPNANSHAAKVIKYLSSGAMTGNIPLHIIVGLPGPLDGFDPSCCKLNYEVCFRVVVYYDEQTCKSCVFTKCFQFDNQ